MTSSSLLLSLVFLLLASSVGELLAVVHADDAGGKRGLTHIHMYMHETFTGPTATTVTVAPSPLAGNVTFGTVGVVDLELRDGPDPSSSSLVGRCQGLFAFAGHVSPPGMLTAVNFVFTAGEHGGSTLAVLDTIMSFEDSFERPVVGGTGAFRMARGYCVTAAVAKPTPESVVYEVNLFVKMDA
jgi:hypothetical protein